MRLNSSLILIFIIFLTLAGCVNPAPGPVTVVDIPVISSQITDGRADDWKSIKTMRLYADPLGNYPLPSDLEAFVSIAWSDKGLCLLFEVHDQEWEYDTINPWNADALEIFISKYRGAEEIIQYTVVPSDEGIYTRIRKQWDDGLPDIISGDIDAVSSFTGNVNITEICIPFSAEYLQHNMSEFALQIYVDDSDHGSTLKNQLVWFPLGQSYNNSSSLANIRVDQNAFTHLKGSSRLVITDNEIITLYIFGCRNGDKVEVFRNDKRIGKFRSHNSLLFKPDSLDLSNSGIDKENDSIFIRINGQSNFLHELLLVPRYYINEKEKRFERDIRNYVYRDRIIPPQEGKTLFVGSSSIVRWESITRDFPEKQIIRRGFGGSTSPEAFMYMDQIVLPYKPSEIVYYEGDNDITMGMSPEEIRENVRLFLERVKNELPGTKVYVISPKPSISRMHLWDKYLQTHSQLRQLCKDYHNAVYVDVATPMFGKDGCLDKSLFVEDGIHLNEKGYALWTRVLRKTMGPGN